MEAGPNITGNLAKVVGGLYVTAGAIFSFLEFFRPIGNYHQQVQVEDIVGLTISGAALYFIGDRIHKNECEKEKREYLKDIYDRLGNLERIADTLDGIYEEFIGKKGP